MAKQKPLYKQIEAGIYKGKKIYLPSLQSTRSTKSILKNSFFNSIQFELEGFDFVEVFGGSGSMGLEALSRGAKRAYFIEIDKLAFEILNKNCMEIDPKNCTTILGDSFAEFPKLLNLLEQKAIFYFDPPFDIRDGMEEIYTKVYDLILSIPSNLAHIIAIEHISSLKTPPKIGIYQKVKTKKFGKSSLSIYRI